MDPKKTDIEQQFKKAADEITARKQDQKQTKTLKEKIAEDRQKLSQIRNTLDLSKSGTPSNVDARKDQLVARSLKQHLELHRKATAKRMKRVFTMAHNKHALKQTFNRHR